MTVKSYLFSSRTFPVFSILLLFIMIGCSSDKPSTPDVEIVELNGYKTVVTIEDTSVVVPSVIRHHNSSHIFVYDKNKRTVLELDENGNTVNRYGRRGRGPGEFLWVKNIFLTDEFLYVVDSMQFLIHQFELAGSFISSFDYGKFVGSPTIPPGPISYSSIRAENINNMPVVTPEGDVLLSAVGFSENSKAIYELRNWEGDHLAYIGDVPDGSSFTLDYDKFRKESDNRKIPGFYRPNAFAVSDQSRSGEYFLVYTAFPRISKYNNEGAKLWESDIPLTREIDSVRTTFYEYMDRTKGKSRILLQYYESGVSDDQGNLYLAMDSDPLWLHRFNKSGKLTKRYKVVSPETDLAPIFDIDLKDKRLFVATKEGEIREYTLAD